jgi:hypothetical protein
MRSDQEEVVVGSRGFSAQHFQKRERVLRRGAFGIIIEVDVHIAIFF